METQLLRTATSEDIPRMLELERGCPSAAHWSEQQYRKIIVTLQSSYLCLVAEGTLVRDSVWSNGRTVLGFLVAQADSLFLEVRESNTAARKLYEKLGFRETGRRKAYYSNPIEEAILYSKTLR